MNNSARPHCPVSVVMPVYRPDPVYFVEAIQSILGQTYRDFEIVIVEDPSDRNAADLLTSLRDRRIRHIRNPERTSLVSQRNRGIEMARGRFVALMDADDVSEPDRLEKQLRFLGDHPDCDVVGSHTLVIDAEGKAQGYRSYPASHDDILNAMHFICPLSNPSVMLRRQALVDAGGYNEEYPIAEDYELWCRMAQRGARFANYPEALCRYRCHSEQAKARRLRETIRAVVAIKQKYWRSAMGFRAILRLWAERALLLLPPRFVWRLIYIAQYRDRMALPAKREAQGTVDGREDALVAAQDFHDWSETPCLDEARFAERFEEPCLADAHVAS